MLCESYSGMLCTSGGLDNFWKLCPAACVVSKGYCAC